MRDNPGTVEGLTPIPLVVAYQSCLERFLLIACLLTAGTEQLAYKTGAVTALTAPSQPSSPIGTTRSSLRFRDASQGMDRVAGVRPTYWNRQTTLAVL
jgi:hypothetical protein